MKSQLDIYIYERISKCIDFFKCGNSLLKPVVKRVSNFVTSRGHLGRTSCNTLHWRHAWNSYASAKVHEEHRFWSAPPLSTLEEINAFDLHVYQGSECSSLTKKLQLGSVMTNSLIACEGPTIELPSPTAGNSASGARALKTWRASNVREAYSALFF